MHDLATLGRLQSLFLLVGLLRESLSPALRTILAGSGVCSCADEGRGGELHLMGGGDSTSVISTALYAYTPALWPETDILQPLLTNSNWWKVAGECRVPSRPAVPGMAVPREQGPPQRARDSAGSKGPRSPGGEGAPGAPRPGRAGKAPRESRQGAAARSAAGKYRRGRRGGEYFPLMWKNAKSPPGPTPSLPSAGPGGEGRGWPEPIRPPCQRRRRRAGPDPSVGL